MKTTLRLLGTGVSWGVLVACGGNSTSTLPSKEGQTPTIGATMAGSTNGAPDSGTGGKAAADSGPSDGKPTSGGDTTALGGTAGSTAGQGSGGAGTAGTPGAPPNIGLCPNGNPQLPKCVPLKLAWELRSEGDGGAGGGGADDVDMSSCPPAEPPSWPGPVQQFGEQCCYAGTPFCG